MNSDSLSRFFGGRPTTVIFRLILMSFVVGFVLSAINIHPLEIFDWVASFAERIYRMGFDAIEWAIRYFILGAIVVVPIWLFLRLTKAGRDR